MPASTHIVVHYNELWLKLGNRLFFLHQLRRAMRRALEGIAVARITQPGDRYLIELENPAELAPALRRLQQVFGISHLAVARPVEWSHRALGQASAGDDAVSQICETAWDEIRTETFSTFAVRAKRSDKRFPHTSMFLEREVGGKLFDKLEAAGRAAKVNLKNPELTCRIEVTRGPILIYARRIAGPGGLPTNTAGRLTCLLSGGFDSAVAAYKMMKRGAHLSFVHFWGGGAEPGESSVHVARRLVEKLVPWQATAKLYLVPFEPLQRQIVAEADESFRTLLYRRLMLRIAERIALRERSKGLVTGDSLGQVASQTLGNLQSVGSIARLPLYRPLIGDDKLEIQELAAKIGTHDISAERFHDCCAILQPKSPALFATTEQLDRAEEQCGARALVERGLQSIAMEKFRYKQGIVEKTAARHRPAAQHLSKG
ncbi:MAG TPA: tRNA uracil 4-sulfurtransferase ThiI [Candidatus Acidoferrum sp.]|nr:tRNA uracil 4-sulfurtransferase ThiI [Candidatus Acidoferrum sp.]